MDNGSLFIASFRRFDNPRHGRDRGHWILARGGLAREHQAIRAVPDGIGHIRRFSPRRPWAGDHRLQHLGRSDDQLPGVVGLLDDCLLIHRHQFDAGFNAQVSARHHHAVGGGDDRIQLIDGLGFFDLGIERVYFERLVPLPEAD